MSRFIDIVLTALATTGLTWLLMRSAERRRAIAEVALEYKRLVDASRNSGPGAVIQAGVCRLRNHREVTQALDSIRDYGLGDPLGSLRERLHGKDLHHFFVVACGDHYSVIPGADFEAAAKNTRSL